VIVVRINRIGPSDAACYQSALDPMQSSFRVIIWRQGFFGMNVPISATDLAKKGRGCGAVGALLNCKEP
jgi:hypothetical protein